MSRVLAGGIEWYYETAGICCERILVLVHGFAQSHYSWDLLLPHLASQFQLVLVDLPGFGKTALPEAEKMALAEVGSAFSELLGQITSTPVYVCGYSMGGRIVLHSLLATPDRFRAGMLIGASPGIMDEQERMVRIQADSELARNIRDRGVEWFAAHWSTLPLFDSQASLPIETQNAILNERLMCHPAGLAFALENFGTGQQDYLMPRLRSLEVPVLLLAGELDRKFCESNKLMALVTDGDLEEIPQSGHAAHVENPAAVAKAMLDFIHSVETDLQIPH